jgi:hypothetical protein
LVSRARSQLKQYVMIVLWRTNCPQNAKAGLALTSPAPAASRSRRLSALPSLSPSAPYLRIFLAVGGRQVCCRTSASSSWARLNGAPSSSASRHCAANARREPFVQPWLSPLSAVEARIDLKSFSAIHKSKLRIVDAASAETTAGESPPLSKSATRSVHHVPRHAHLRETIGHSRMSSSASNVQAWRLDQTFAEQSDFTLCSAVGIHWSVHGQPRRLICCRARSAPSIGELRLARATQPAPHRPRGAQE